MQHEIGNRTYIVADVEPLDVDGVRTVTVGTIAWLVAFVALLRLGRWLSGHPGIADTFGRLRHATSQVAVRGSLALMLLFVALSETLGTEVILGAFLAGVLLALLSPQDDSTGELREKLEALGFGFFIPIFFILVGVRFDLRALAASPQSLTLALLLILSAFAIKMLASLPFRLLVSWRETLVPAEHSELPRWRNWLYRHLVAGALSPARFNHLPPNRVVELGTQVTI